MAETEGDRHTEDQNGHVYAKSAPEAGHVYAEPAPEAGRAVAETAVGAGDLPEGLWGHGKGPRYLHDVRRHAGVVGGEQPRCRGQRQPGPGPRDGGACLRQALAAGALPAAAGEGPAHRVSARAVWLQEQQPVRVEAARQEAQLRRVLRRPAQPRGLAPPRPARLPGDGGGRGALHRGEAGRRQRAHRDGPLDGRQVRHGGGAAAAPAAGRARGRGQRARRLHGRRDRVQQVRQVREAAAADRGVGGRALAQGLRRAACPRRVEPAHPAVLAHQHAPGRRRPLPLPRAAGHHEPVARQHLGVALFELGVSLGRPLALCPRHAERLRRGRVPRGHRQVFPQLLHRRYRRRPLAHQ